MVCDIHAFLEVKIENIWHLYSQIPFSRNYVLFSRMGAPFKNETINIIPISTPRGLPEDVSFIVKNFICDYYGEDGHSHSWLSSQEVVDLYHWLRKSLGSGYEDLVSMRKDDAPWYGGDWDIAFGVWLFDDSLHYFHKYREDFPEKLEDFRIVFFFDN